MVVFAKVYSMISEYTRKLTTFDLTEIIFKNPHERLQDNIFRNSDTGLEEIAPGVNAFYREYESMHLFKLFYLKV